MSSNSILIKSELKEKLENLWPKWKIFLTRPNKNGEIERKPSFSEIIKRLLEERERGS
jgi:hypothetical protein